MKQHDMKITVKILLKLLKISYSKLDQWVQHKVFVIGNSRPGSGFSREFTFLDVVTAKLILSVLEAVNSFDIAREIARDFRAQMKSGTVFIENAYLIKQLSKDKSHFWLSDKVDITGYVTLLSGPALVVPMSKIFEEVEAFFVGLEETAKEQKAVLA